VSKGEFLLNFLVDNIVARLNEVSILDTRNIATLKESLLEIQANVVNKIYKSFIEDVCEFYNGQLEAIPKNWFLPTKHIGEEKLRRYWMR